MYIALQGFYILWLVLQWSVQIRIFSQLDLFRSKTLNNGAFYIRRNFSQENCIFGIYFFILTIRCTCLSNVKSFRSNLLYSIVKIRLLRSWFIYMYKIILCSSQYCLFLFFSENCSIHFLAKTTPGTRFFVVRFWIRAVWTL